MQEIRDFMTAKVNIILFAIMHPILETPAICLYNNILAVIEDQTVVFLRESFIWLRGDINIG